MALKYNLLLYVKIYVITTKSLKYKSRKSNIRPKIFNAVFST